MTDYNELIERLRNAGGGDLGIKMCHEAADAIEQLVNDRNASVDALKALGANIDAEPVVRCRDCVHWGKHDDVDVPGETERIKGCEWAFWMIGDNGYCSYGERKAVASDGK